MNYIKNIHFPAIDITDVNIQARILLLQNNKATCHKMDVLFILKRDDLHVMVVKELFMRTFLYSSISLS